MSEQSRYDADDILHHSRWALFRAPFGAVESGSAVVLRLSLSERLHRAFCLLCATVDGAEHVYEMTRVESESRRGRLLYEAVLKLPEGFTGTAWYYFIVNDHESLTYCGSGGFGGRGVVSAALPGLFQITVYKAGYTTPDWFKKGVLYQIFVDRFARGEGLGGLDRTAEREAMGRDTFKHADWDDMPLYQPVYGRKYYEPCDFFGGDLRGVINKLDYLASLGVGCIYLNPIFEAHSNHKYDTGDYLRVDPMYGDDETLRELCAEAKKRGISVMLDGVFSHTGADSVYFNRYGRYPSEGAYQSPVSPYFDWYTFFSYPDGYKSWWGFEALPEVREDEPSYREYILTGADSVVAHWLRRGVAGWRLDVADELPDDFIALMRSVLKREDPDAVLLGEVWEDASHKRSMNTDRQYVMGDELDSVMNYPQRGIIMGFLLGRLGAKDAADQLHALRENYPAEFYNACMNLLGSHDMPRVLSLLGGAPDKDAELSRDAQAQFSLTSDQVALGVARFKLASLLQFALPGVPCIYYGDEAGMTGLMDPFNRATFPWGGENQETLGWHRALAAHRKELWVNARCVLAPFGDDVLAVIRFEKVPVVALVNRSTTWTRVVRLPLCESDGNPPEGPDAEALCAFEVDGRYEDLLGGEGARCVNRTFSAVLPPLRAALFVRKENADYTESNSHAGAFPAPSKNA